MALKTWDTMIKKALTMYCHRNDFAYFYGAKGEVLTENYMDYLIRCYPTHFSKYTLEQLQAFKNYSIGKIGYDCSGFISAVSDLEGNSTMLFNTCTNISDNLAAGPAGSFLYRPGHIGLDVGFGMYVHMPREGESILFGKISEYPWERTGVCTYINMEGSDSR